jgi:hypothetical protein
MLLQNLQDGKALAIRAIEQMYDPLIATAQGDYDNWKLSEGVRVKEHMIAFHYARLLRRKFDINRICEMLKVMDVAAETAEK